MGRSLRPNSTSSCSFFWNEIHFPSFFRVFLVRDSQSSPGAFVLTLKFGAKVLHKEITPMSNSHHDTICYTLDNGQTKFYDLLQLIEFYQLNMGSLPTRLTHYLVQSPTGVLYKEKSRTRDAPGSFWLCSKPPLATGVQFRSYKKSRRAEEPTYLWNSMASKGDVNICKKKSVYCYFTFFYLCESHYFHRKKETIKRFVLYANVNYSENLTALIFVIIK